MISKDVAPVIITYISSGSSTVTMANPYEVSKTPQGDPYRSTPLYDRYKAADDYVAPMTPSMAEIISLCGSENDMIPDYPDHQCIYAIQGIIIKGHHKVGSVLQDHSFGDANEAAAIALVSAKFLCHKFTSRGT